MSRNKLDCPREFMYAFDNGGEENIENGGTVDRYTILFSWENGDSVLVSTNAVASVWGLGFNEWINPDEVTNEDGHIGKDIDWQDLPEELRIHLNDYFSEDFSYI